MHAAGPCVAAIDPDKLQRVVMNLLGNAFKFVPDGGGIRCSLRQAAEEIVIAVDDSGPGVKPELRQAIFERFRQGDGGINRTVAGTGLGLAIAKEFVEMHKGRITVLDSDLGGARFEVALPVSRIGTGAAAAGAAAGLDRDALDGVLEELRFTGIKPKAAEPAAVPPVAGRPRILVVEDNPDMNRFVVECLSRDYDVATAFDGREGVEQARETTELQQRLLHSVFVQAPLLIAVLRGPDHVIELANPPMCEQIWKRHESELLNRPLFEVIPELGGQVVRPLLRNVYETGVPYVGRETPVTFERGGGVSEVLSFDFVYSAFHNMAGEIEGIFVVASDVTAQVTARQQVDDLRVAAESANRAKDEFLAMLGHELRNPLSPILTALQLMKLRGDAGARARAHDHRAPGRSTSSRLVDDLLDVSRITRGKVELKTERVELAEVVAKADRDGQPAARAADAHA